MSRLLAAVAAGTSGEGIIENVTEQLYNKCAAQLISTAIGSGKTEVGCVGVCGCKCTWVCVGVNARGWVWV